MSTIHLIYSSLEHAFNIQEKHDITLIHRRKEIKNILSECCLVPNVIENIIFKYTDTEINISAYTNNRRSYIDENDMCNIYLRLITDDYDVTIRFANDTNKTIIVYGMCLRLLNNNIGYNYDCNKLPCCAGHLNVFMEKIYGKNNYINYDYSETQDVYYMIKNSVYCKNDSLPFYKDHGMTITNYKKFTYLIVTLKCIINGVQKYFREHNIREYCDKN